MMMTSEWALIMDEADLLTEMILSSEVVKAYFNAYEKVYENPVLVDKLRRFIKMKELYEEVQRFGRYHPNYQETMKEIRVLKRELDIDEHIAALKVAENDVQDLLDEVSLLVGKTVSDSVKVPVSNPFFATDSSCGSSCGTGGSCSCSA
ncbi:YlbF family regulator [Paenisporosarcina cavernae]|uniref:YlbF family regulator n=1 Tax=Paenisporosarcina cavernae TaxID=2320858 RepID=A0A385YT95_9BACL|nr:YlbF family regulator [Paenisporosarcina cavernae]AYC29137.1 YlbF family regulator [Paenisporosarcina cavernae]